jgi:hypothetical protein
MSEPRFIMLLRVYFQRNWEFDTAVLKTQPVPSSKHFSSRLETDQFVLYGVQVAVRSEINKNT